MWLFPHYVNRLDRPTKAKLRKNLANEEEGFPRLGEVGKSGKWRLETPTNEFSVETSQRLQHDTALAWPLGVMQSVESWDMN